MVDNGKYNQVYFNDKETLSDSDIIYLMDIYEREWEHRDKTLWMQSYRLFYISLVMILIPNLQSNSNFQIVLPQIPSKVFTLIGLLLAVISLFISWSYGIRLEASSKTYAKLIEKLPKSCRRVRVDELYSVYGKKMILKNPFDRSSSIFNLGLAKVMTSIFFISEIIVAALILFRS